MKETLVTPKNFPNMFGQFKKALKNTTHFTAWIFHTGNMKEVLRFFHGKEKSSLTPDKHRMLLRETVIMRHGSGEAHGAAVQLPDYQRKKDFRNVFSPGDKVVITPLKIFIRVQRELCRGEPIIIVIDLII